MSKRTTSWGSLPLRRVYLSLFVILLKSKSFQYSFHHNCRIYPSLGEICCNCLHSDFQIINYKLEGNIYLSKSVRILWQVIIVFVHYLWWIHRARFSTPLPNSGLKRESGQISTMMMIHILPCPHKHQEAIYFISLRKQIIVSSIQVVSHLAAQLRAKKKTSKFLSDRSESNSPQ